MLQQIAAKWEQHNVIMDNEFLTEEYKLIYLDILNQQREWLLQKNIDDKLIDEEIIRKHFRHLDLEEEKLQFL